MAEIGPDSVVSLREINQTNFGEILSLHVGESQGHLVATNAQSLAEAFFHQDIAWFRAIYAAETPVGFLMLADEPAKPEYFLWRLMIDGRYQGLGYGYQAVERLVDYVKTRPQATELLVSYVPAEGNPGPFYEKCGFVETGEVIEGEKVMRLSLAAAASSSAP